MTHRHHESGPNTVAAQLEADIESGEWPAGTAIPPRLRLAERYRTSQTTVDAAIRPLVANGVLISQGKGRRVLVGGAGVQPTPTLRDSVAAQLKADIESGEWPADTAIPSQRLLADRYNTSQSTVEAAIKPLIADGVLISQGRGRRALVAGAGVQPTPTRRDSAAAQLEADIERGEWPAGTATPSC